MKDTPDYQKADSDQIRGARTSPARPRLKLRVNRPGSAGPDRIAAATVLLQFHSTYLTLRCGSPVENSIRSHCIWIWIRVIVAAELTFASWEIRLYG